MSQIYNCLFLLLVAVLVQCSVNVAGGGSDLPDKNIVIGKIYSHDLIPASNTQVMIIPADYNALHDDYIPSAQIDTTDSEGNYKFAFSAKAGTYNIQAVHIYQRTRLLINGITIGEDVSNVPSDTLRYPGTVKIFFPENTDPLECRVFIPGTSISSENVSGEHFLIIDSVPAGMISKVCYVTTNDSVPSATRYDLFVQSQDTTVIAKPEWKFSRFLYLNTTSSGTLISENLVNFPLLIRLNSDNFNFSQAKADGADIRFTKSDTSFLPYEIKRWDITKQLAEIWVKVDTVYRNDSTQSIAMLWGNPDASDNSKGADVFDTADGFAGVWHLGESSGKYASDATHNNFKGNYSGELPQNIDCPVGIGQNITIIDSQYVDMGNVLNPGLKNISIGIWFKLGSFISPQALVGKTNGDLPNTGYGYLFSIDPINRPHFNMASDGTDWGQDGTLEIESTIAIEDTVLWHYAFVSIDRTNNDNCKLYIDGIDRTGTVKGTVSLVMNVNNELHLCIGTENDRNRSLTGAVAEASISFVTRSADWVKMSYLNQKAQDALIKW